MNNTLAPVALQSRADQLTSGVVFVHKGMELVVRSAHVSPRGFVEVETDGGVVCFASSDTSVTIIL